MHTNDRFELVNATELSAPSPESIAIPARPWENYQIGIIMEDAKISFLVISL